MISRALIRLFPFLCLLVLAASAKHDDSPSRRMSSPGYYGKKEFNRRVKGMDKNNKNKDASSAPPRMENDWRRLEGTDRANTRSNRRELRFLKEKSSTTKTKTKDDSKSKSKSKNKNKNKNKSKTDPKSTEIPRPVLPTPPPTVAVTPAPTPVDRERERGIVSGVEAVVYDNDDGLLH